MPKQQRLQALLYQTRILEKDVFSELPGQSREKEDPDGGRTRPYMGTVKKIGSIPERPQSQRKETLQ